MAVQSREQLFQQIKDRLADDTSDDAIKFLEDVTDTLDDYDAKIGEDWKTKYETNDREWRQKYTDRFFSGEKDEPEDEPDIQLAPQKLTFEALFKEE